MLTFQLVFEILPCVAHELPSHPSLRIQHPNQFTLRHHVALFPLSLTVTSFHSRRLCFLCISQLFLVSPFSPFALLLLLITTRPPASATAMADGPPRPPRPPFLSRLPRWLSRWLGYRDTSPPAPPHVYVLYLWPFIGAFCGLSLLQAVFGHADYFIDRGVPSIIASYVSVSQPCHPAIHLPKTSK
jgi:hypothetical protein